MAFVLFVSLFAPGPTAYAVAPSSGITYAGHIVDENDQPVTASLVLFTITITDPDQKCWLYTEQRMIDMSNSAGSFSFEVGSSDPTTLYGTPAFNNPLSGGPKNFSELFDNSKSFSNLLAGSYSSCPGSYNPSTSTDKNEGRIMAIFFRVGATGTDQALPALRISPVPLAMQATNAANINGYGSGRLLKVSSTVTQTQGDLTQAHYDEFIKLILGTSTTYLKAVPALGGDVTGTLPAMTVTKIRNTDIDAPVTSGDVLTYNGTKMIWQTPAGTGLTSLNGLTSNTQSFVVGSAGNAPAISSAGSSHTLNIPLASAAGTVTAGLVSNADYLSFASKQSSALAAGQVWVGNASSVAEARTLSGDIFSVSSSGLVTANKSTTGQSNYIMALDGSGIANAYGFGVKGATSGTVTLNAPSSPANYSLTLPAVQGGANQVLSNDGTGILSWASVSTGISNLASLTNGKLWVGNASGIAAEVNISGDATIDSAGLLTLKNTGAIGTYYKVATDAQGRVVSGSALAAGDITTALTYTPVNRAGDTMAGDLNTQNINMAANKYFSLSANSTDGTVAGQMWYDAGTIKYFDGSSVKSLSASSAGITTLNGLSSTTQSFVIGSAGNAPAISSAGSVHTLDIPLASASGTVTAGLVSNADYLSMMAKQSPSLAAGKIWVGNSSGVATAVTMSGDATISSAGLLTVDKTQAAAANKILQLNALGIANTEGVDVTTFASTVYATSSAAVHVPNGGASIAINNWQETSNTSALIKMNVYNSSSNDQYGYIGAVSTSGGVSWAPSIVFGQSTGATAYSESMRIHYNGNVGIGTTTPSAKLSVAGAIVSAPSTLTGATVDLSTSNTLVLSTIGGSAITLQNMVHGGTYTLVIKDTTTRTYTFSGCNTTKYNPSNSATIAGTESIYTILTVYNGATYDCYVTWATGYN